MLGFRNLDTYIGKHKKIRLVNKQDGFYVSSMEIILSLFQLLSEPNVLLLF